MDWNSAYTTYRELFTGFRFPLAFVDLDRFDRNVAYVAATQKQTGKTIRIASKSIRCVDLLKRVFDKGGPVFKGILSFTMEEAAFLIDQGFNDIIVAYPSVQASDLALFAQKTAKGANVTMMADCWDHLLAISDMGEKEGVLLKVCLDVDMSFRPIGSLIHLGVRRSPLFRPDQVTALTRKAVTLPGIKICAIMGYEAQIASVNDNLPGQSLKNKVIQWVKKRSNRDLSLRRAQMVQLLSDEGICLDVVNGGGQRQPCFHRL